MIDLVVDPLREAFMVRAILETTLIGVTAGILGCWVILYGLSYAGESMAHSIFPGLVVAVAIGAPLLVGGIPAIALAALAIGAASRLPGIDRDTSVAVVVTGMFGLGGLLALNSQAAPGLADVLFGDILGTTTSDLIAAAALAALVLGVAAVLHSRILALGFDPGMARSLGLGAGRVDLAVLVLLAGTVLVAVQGLGNLLVVAILVAPAATARHLTDRVATMMALSAALAVAIGAGGLYASYYLGTAAGASIAALAVICYLSVALLTGRRATSPTAAEAT